MSVLDPPVPSLQVSLELRAAGEGLLNTELLQLCARVEGGRELFLPVQCREAEVPLASLESLGFQCEDRAWSFLQPDTRKRLEVVSQEEAAARLLRWLEAELRRTERSGVLLVFLHRETLLLLLSWLSVEETARLGRSVCCWAALEGAVLGALGREGEGRLSHALVVEMMGMESQT